MTTERMKNLHPYVPGEQPKDRDYIKLNANENPYPPSPVVAKTAVRVARKYAARLGLYPDPDSNALKSAIAAMLNQTGGVLCRTELRGGKKNGSDEVLSFVFYAFFDSDRPVVLPSFTYSFYPVYAGFYAIPLNAVPLRSDWSLDTQNMLAEANATDSGIIFANPNAPTGIGLTRAQVDAMIRAAPKDRVFVVDEAYVDFGGESCIPLLAEHKNLLIVRTFSKSLCGAGMRLGYVVASPELVAHLTIVKNSLNHFPVDVMAQRLGIAACGDAGYYARCARLIVRERGDFAAFLRARGWFVLPSQTNFVFAKKDGVCAEETYRAIKAAGILVRHFSAAGIEDFLRITIGTRAQMDALKAVMESL